MNKSKAPVFVFSACWRTGSTLLQRLLNTTDELLIWGEPASLRAARRMFNIVNRVSDEAQWVRDQVEEEELHRLWTPTILPDSKYIVPAFRDLFDGLYGEPSLALGRSRWGFKEVRDDALENAIMFRRIYPDAKIVFHYRHPFDVYASLKKTDFFSEFEEFPFRPMQVWARNYASFSADEAKALNPFVISHEEIVKTLPGENRRLQQLFDYVGIELTGVCDEVIGSKLGGSSDGAVLTQVEKEKIREILGENEIDVSEQYPDI